MKTLTDIIVNFLKKRGFPQRVSFDDGSYIEFFNREALMYAEKDGHRMEVMWFFQPSGPMRGRVLNPDHINRWDAPHEREFLSITKKEEIQRKIVEYCLKQRIPLKIRGVRDQT